MSTVAADKRESPLREWPLPLALVTLIAAFLSKSWIAGALGQPVIVVALLASLCAVILVLALAIVRHADELANRLGEPAGTLLLTLAITGLEVAMVAFVMSTGEEKSTLARDTMFAVVMLVFNGLMGLALLIGGMIHCEQKYNLQSANSFLVLIVPLTVLGLVLPNYTRQSPGPTLSTTQMVTLSIMSVGIYSIFLYVQNGRHRGYFMLPDEGIAASEPPHRSSHSTYYHTAMLGLYGLPLVLLAKQMALPLDTLVVNFGAPVSLGGFVMAVLVLTPESIAAIKAARANRLQRSVNILLGSVLASIGLTIPLVTAVSLATDRKLVLGLDPAEVVMLVLTLVTATLTFSLPRTNVLLGCVHLLLFGVYFMLIFDQ